MFANLGQPWLKLAVQQPVAREMVMVRMNDGGEAVVMWRKNTWRKNTWRKNTWRKNTWRRHVYEHEWWCGGRIVSMVSALCHQLCSALCQHYVSILTAFVVSARAKRLLSVLRRTIRCRNELSKAARE
jgi:hypothetical protein